MDNGQICVHIYVYVYKYTCKYILNTNRKNRKVHMYIYICKYIHELQRNMLNGPSTKTESPATSTQQLASPKKTVLTTLQLVHPDFSNGLMSAR